jgi:hypothetical protein
VTLDSEAFVKGSRLTSRQDSRYCDGPGKFLGDRIQRNSCNGLLFAAMSYHYGLCRIHESQNVILANGS